MDILALLEYANHIEANSFVINWIKTTVINFTQKESVSTEEVEHILDYLVSEDAPKRISRISYPQAKEQAEKWVERMNKKGSEVKETSEDTKIVLDFGDGFKVVQLIGQNAYKREGYLMRNCVASYFGNSSKIYSLRDSNNLPHCTMEENRQVKGKGNGDIHPKYVNYVVKFLEFIGMTVGDSEMLHLGYIPVGKLEKELGKETKSKLFNKKYLYKNEKLIDKEGKEFSSFDLLDQVPLISETRFGLKINFELPVYLRLSIDFLLKKVKGNILKNTAKRYAKIGSSGDYAQIGSSGYYAQIGSSGYYAKIGSSGYSAQIGSSGYSAKIGSSGDYAKIGSSGYSAKIGSSGYSAQIGSSGYYAQIGSSGYSAKIGSSGDYAKIGSSGYSAKIGSSGDYAQIDITGEKSVGANISINGKIKGVLGTWITLAEYDFNRNPVCVKSAQIDGKVLLPDTWYRLVGGEFIKD